MATDRERFAKVVGVLAVFYDREVSAARMSAWYSVLGDYPIESVEAAARQHMRESKFLPEPSELIERMKPNTEQAALLAWPEVVRLAANSGSAKSADAITEKVVHDLGGWTAIGRKSASELVWVAKEFERRYSTYAQHGLDVVALTGPNRRVIEATKQIGRRV